MNNAMQEARTSLVRPVCLEKSQQLLEQRLSLKVLPSLLSIGNVNAHFAQLMLARLALQIKGVTDGYLVFLEDGEVKYYDEQYAVAVVNMATFTNMPVYSILVYK